MTMVIGERAVEEREVRLSYGVWLVAGVIHHHDDCT